ncbi:MAG: 5'-3' exonuclease [Schlesneria sp.]
MSDDWTQDVDEVVGDYAIGQPVVIVDLMNVLVRAWFAGAPSQIHAVKSLLFTCANIIERLNPSHLLFAGDGGHVQRSRLYPDYKAHRPPKPDGLAEQIALADQALEAIGWPVIRAIGWEADDVAASLGVSIATKYSDAVICSCDKDLCQFVGYPGIQIYHPWGEGSFLSVQQIREKFGINPDQIADYLALIGDTSDNIPGVNGIGPKTAAALLVRYGNLETVLEEARLLRIAGATCKKLREHAESARLSRRLIELERRIPIPDDWKHWPATDPKSGWLESLRDIGLGSAARLLQELLPAVGRVRSGFAAMSIEWMPTPTCNEELSNSDKPIIPQIEQKTEEHCLAEDGQAVAQRQNYPSWIHDFPVLARVAADAPDVEKCKSVYADVARDRLKGKPRENPWRVGTGFHLAFEAALRGDHFSSVTPFIPATAKPEMHQSNNVVAKPFVKTKREQLSLFS